MFNMLRLAEKEIGPGDRPINPPKITRTEVHRRLLLMDLSASACFCQVLSNPFDDIVPRDIRHNKVEMLEKPVKQSKSKGTKSDTTKSHCQQTRANIILINQLGTSAYYHSGKKQKKTNKKSTLLPQ